MKGLKERQLQSIKRMLDISEDRLWKILVIDDLGRDIISVLLSASDLRSLGVTLFLHIDSKKSKIPDVPAVYLCEPTKENIKSIAKDVENELYGSFFLNFTRTVPTDILAELASLTSKIGKSHLIEKVYDQFVSYIALENDLFTLSIPRTFVTLYDTSGEGTTMAKLSDRIAEGLLSVFATMNSTPVLASPRGKMADMVAVSLCKKMADYSTTYAYFSRYHVDPNNTSLHEVLVLLDRDIDLAVMFHHPWTYEAQVRDYLKFHLNVVEYSENSGDGGAEKAVSFDIVEEDFFWRANRFSEFPTLAQAVEKLLSTYQMNTKRVGEDVQGNESGKSSHDDRMFQTHAKAMRSALESIPELQKTKALLAAHTNIAHAMMEQIKTRHLDVFHSVEEDIISKYTAGSQYPNEDKYLMNLIKDSGEKGGLLGGASDEERNERKSTPEDKMRLFLVYYWIFKEIPGLEEIEAILKDAGCDMRPYYFIRNVKREMLAGNGKGGSKDGNSLLSRFSTYLRPSSSDFASTEILLALMENKLNSTTEQFEIRDPKLENSSISLTNRSTFNEAYIFQVGAGSCTEFQNAVSAVKRVNPKKSVVYGATELYSSIEFMKELAEGYSESKMG